MSTYNGEKYIREQIDSILAQDHVDVYIHIFDDCSKDSTIKIAREYEKTSKKVKIQINEKNKNYTYNFLDGLFSFKDNEEYDYYAFADQDDFWVKDKIITAINKIKEIGECTLYASNLRVVDDKLEYLGRNFRRDDYVYHHHDQMCFCLVTGCTAVFDKSFKNLATKHYPENLIYHDYWVGLIADYVKDAHFYLDMNPNHILYRQHGKNASGGSLKYGLINRLKVVFAGHKQNFHILKLLLKYYGNEINENDKILIEKFINYKKFKNKIYLFKKFKGTRANRFRFKILFNRYKDKKLEEM